jgi:hypothetical protein
MLSHRFNELHFNFNFNACASVWVFLTTTVQRTILKALGFLLRRLPDNDIYDVPKHVGDLLISDVHIFVHVMLVI